MSEVPELWRDETRNCSRPHTVLSHVSPLHALLNVCKVSVIRVALSGAGWGARETLVVAHERQTAACHKCISRQYFHCPKRAACFGFLKKSLNCLKI